MHTQSQLFSFSGFVLDGRTICFLDVKQYPQWEEVLPHSQECLLRASAVKELAINFKS